MVALIVTSSVSIGSGLLNVTSPALMLASGRVDGAAVKLASAVSSDGLGVIRIGTSTSPLRPARYVLKAAVTAALAAVSVAG